MSRGAAHAVVRALSSSATCQTSADDRWDLQTGRSLDPAAEQVDGRWAADSVSSTAVGERPDTLQSRRWAKRALSSSVAKYSTGPELHSTPHTEDREAGAPGASSRYLHANVALLKQTPP